MTPRPVGPRIPTLAFLLWKNWKRIDIDDVGAFSRHAYVIVGSEDSLSLGPFAGEGLAEGHYHTEG
jgi:hypothetical protein